MTAGMDPGPAAEAVLAESGLAESGPAEAVLAEAVLAESGLATVEAEPEVIAPAAPASIRSRLSGYLTRGIALAQHNPLFCVVLAVAALLRILIVVAYQPIFWFPDSVTYLATAINYTLNPQRPGGYSVFLAVLGPLHSFPLIGGLQALMGLGTAVAMYALLRHRGLPGWGATLATLPVLFDAYELQLEHMLVTDTLFLALATWVVVLLCWNDRIGTKAAIVAGLMLGYATVVRSVGIPMLAVVVVCLLLRKVGWRQVVALVVACGLPVVIYMAEFDFQNGSFAITNSTGIFLYDRVMAFANCATIKPSPALAVLCDPRPQSQRRQPPIEYIWGFTDPIYSLSKPIPVIRPLLGTSSGQVLLVRPVDTNIFTPHINKLAEEFAERAILAQPLSYLHVAAADTLRSFYWGSPIPYDKSNTRYLFTYKFEFSRLVITELRQYDPGMPRPHVDHALASFFVNYQRYVYLQGPMLAVIVAIGLAGVIARRRRWGGLALLPWALGALLLVLPPLTIGYNSRYVLATVPCFCLAAALAFRRREADTS
jgi:hypothetical protein